MNHNCSKEEVLDYLREDIKEIKQDVKSLLADKHRRSGMVYVFSGIVSVIVAILGKALL